jgi:hypothetical protein
MTDATPTSAVSQDDLLDQTVAALQRVRNIQSAHQNAGRLRYPADTAAAEPKTGCSRAAKRGFQNNQGCAIAHGATALILHNPQCNASRDRAPFERVVGT